MKIYFEGCAYYTRERFLEMVRSNAKYVIDPLGTYYSNKIGYAKEIVENIDGRDWAVFKPEQLEDDEIIYLLSSLYGGIIKDKFPKELAEAFGFSLEYYITTTREIEVKV